MASRYAMDMSNAQRRRSDRAEQEGALLAQHLAGDHEPLDLLRALVDLCDLRVAHEALDGVLLDIAVPAEDLYGIRRHGHRHVTALELRHRRRLRELRVVHPGVDHLAEAVEEAARGLALGLHVRELRLDELVLRDRLA